MPVNQSFLEPYTFYPDSGVVNDVQGNIVPDNWYSKKLRSIVSPVQDDVEIEIDNSVVKDRPPNTLVEGRSFNT